LPLFPSIWITKHAKSNGTVMVCDSGWFTLHCSCVWHVGSWLCF
jgi:hypothetical protein